MERLMVVKTRFINASRCQLQLERSRRRRRRENKPTPPFLFASPLSLSAAIVKEEDTTSPEFRDAIKAGIFRDNMFQQELQKHEKQETTQQVEEYF
ncbi:hypothetical protein OUZ56_008669 [Daphnia magna]|uniref:Uncharacterized protein n=1 Tax=Daphnia magna TaxID=35525 RepID=A0ABR0AE29_9CRUS|nr:hypothetical protein OUZ56_008669 [Daphnia magna]